MERDVCVLKHLDTILLVIYLLIVTALSGYYTFGKSDGDLLVSFLLSALTLVITSTRLIKKYQND